MIHNWTEVCNLLEFKLDCSPSTKISFIVDRIIDRHGGASFLDDRGGELHSESSQFSDSLEELMQDLSICFSSICWVYCIIQSTSPLTVYLSIGSKLDAADTFQLLQLRASDSGHFRAWTSFLTGLAIFIFPQKINFVLPKLMVEMIIFPGFSQDFPMIFPSKTAIDQVAPLAISRFAWTASILRRSLAESRARMYPVYPPKIAIKY